LAFPLELGNEHIDNVGGVPGGVVENDPIEFGIDWSAGTKEERLCVGIEVERR
jgi:hypothetical protein